MLRPLGPYRPELEVLMKLGAYELLERIAVGGMAEVYRGRAVGEGGFEKLVAIKRILPHLARDSRFVSMLVQEARIHAGLSHRNIVQIHDLGQSEDDEYFIVLEYVDGRDLGALLQVMSRAAAPGNRLGDAVALHVVIELGLGVHCAHELCGGDGQSAGLVHRDISPSNVLVSYAGEVKLSDFGLAKRQTDQSVVGSLKGKLAYMSPEQARRWPLDRRSDIFSLGAVLFELLTGRRLREIEDEGEGWRLVASGVMSSPRSLRPDMPAPLEGLLKGALAPDPKDRFQDAAAFVNAAKQALEQVARPHAGEASELQLVLRSFLPPGAPRPEQPPSRVIRLQSQFFGSPGLSQDMGTTRPGPMGARVPVGTPPPPQPPAQAQKATLQGTPPVPPIPLQHSRASLPGPVTPPAPLTAFPRTSPAAPLRGPASQQRRRHSPPPERVPADDLLPVAGELALPPRHDRPAPSAQLALQIPPLRQVESMNPHTVGGESVVQRSPSSVPPAVARATPLRLTPARPTPARATPARPTPARPAPLGATPGGAIVGRQPLMELERPLTLSPRAAALAMGTPGIDPAAVTPRLIARSSASRASPSRAVSPRRLLPSLLGLLCMVALATHFFVVPLPVLLRWSQPAKLVVQSVPEGAQVWLDGELLPEVTPTFLNVARDRKPHVLQLQKEGFQPVVRAVRFDRSVRLTVNAHLIAAEGLHFRQLPKEALPQGAQGGARAEDSSSAPDSLVPSAAASVIKDDGQERVRAHKRRKAPRANRPKSRRRSH